MERRTLLIGSGVAFATVLAGCTGSDDSDDENGDSGTDDGGTGSDANGDDNGTGGDDDGAGGDDGNGGDDDGNGGGDSIGSVPGFDEDKLELDEFGLRVERVERSGSEIHVDVEATEASLERDNLEKLAETAVGAIDDPDAFKGTISSFEFTVVDDAGNTLLSFFIDVEWAVAYLKDELSIEEFADRVDETAG